jgi:hypothetical protein
MEEEEEDDNEPPTDLDMCCIGSIRKSGNSRTITEIIILSDLYFDSMNMLLILLD